MADLIIKNIFLTGATGFLGAYLIKNLIKEKPDKVYCHVRCKNEEEGFARIKENMNFYKLWNDEYAEFIVPVKGSLDKPFLGMDKNMYYYLCNNADIIYHNGAAPISIYTYENLKGVNVMGTIRTIDIACTGKIKYYNYVSSCSVYDNPRHIGKLCLEDDPLEDEGKYDLSYSETKWVCEKIINLARTRGLKASVYRPGDITGSISTGIWKCSDMVSRLIKSILKYGVYPDWDKKIHMTSVDYVAQAISNISKQVESYGHAYNLVNKNYLTIDKIAELIKGCGYDLNQISCEEWINDIADADMSNPLKPVEFLLKSEDNQYMNSNGNGAVIYDTSNVENMLSGSGIMCHEIDGDIMKKYIENFK